MAALILDMMKAGIASLTTDESHGMLRELATEKVAHDELCDQEALEFSKTPGS
jgi:hypothetical protein